MPANPAPTHVSVSTAVHSPGPGAVLACLLQLAKAGQHRAAQQVQRGVARQEGDRHGTWWKQHAARSSPSSPWPPTQEEAGAGAIRKARAAPLHQSIHQRLRLCLGQLQSSGWEKEGRHRGVSWGCTGSTAAQQWRQRRGQWCGAGRCHSKSLPQHPPCPTAQHPAAAPAAQSLHPAWGT